MTEAGIQVRKGKKGYVYDVDEDISYPGTLQVKFDGVSVPVTVHLDDVAHAESNEAFKHEDLLGSRRNLGASRDKLSCFSKCSQNTRCQFVNYFQYGGCYSCTPPVATIGKFPRQTSDYPSKGSIYRKKLAWTWYLADPEFVDEPGHAYFTVKGKLCFNQVDTAQDARTDWLTNFQADHQITFLAGENPYTVTFSKAPSKSGKHICGDYKTYKRGSPVPKWRFPPDISKFGGFGVVRMLGGSCKWDGDCPQDTICDKNLCKVQDCSINDGSGLNDLYPCTCGTSICRMNEICKKGSTPQCQPATATYVQHVQLHCGGVPLEDVHVEGSLEECKAVCDALGPDGQKKR